MSKELSLCPDCNCMTKNICGKCGLLAIKEELLAEIVGELVSVRTRPLDKATDKIRNLVIKAFNKHASKEVKE